eukprot:TRINITY_DN6601_c1_g1_i1.p2 TRINITY_DN6601_c1_g1~~TRINITY_DN6601_c1_g1_i1.p2  ORF type:complete len:159 (+),score=36.72 TRINITY_DN6601_c1_g1_i1:842-1318(+)
MHAILDDSIQEVQHEIVSVNQTIITTDDVDRTPNVLSVCVQWHFPRFSRVLLYDPSFAQVFSTNTPETAGTGDSDSSADDHNTKVIMIVVPVVVLGVFVVAATVALVAGAVLVVVRYKARRKRQSMLSRHTALLTTAAATDSDGKAEGRPTKTVWDDF